VVRSSTGGGGASTGAPAGGTNGVVGCGAGGVDTGAEVIGITGIIGAADSGEGADGRTGPRWPRLWCNRYSSPPITTRLIHVGKPPKGEPPKNQPSTGTSTMPSRMVNPDDVELRPLPSSDSAGDTSSSSSGRNSQPSR
jgi:hypothetical protein